MIYTGKVKDLDKGSEPWGQASRQVWTFKLIRIDEATNNPLPIIPVRMKGYRIDGILNNDDEVSVEGNWQPGEILDIKELFNITNNITVKRKFW